MAGADKKNRKYKLVRPVRRWVNRVIQRNSLVGDEPSYDPDIFPWTRELETHWEAIRDEAMAIWQHNTAIPSFADVVPGTSKIVYEDTWRTFFLYNYGHRVEENCRRAPATAKAVEQIPGMTLAMFSFLDPQLHIPRHRGVSKYYLTCHLGLKVPAEREKCRIEVRDRTLYWKEGKTIVFDDMHEHEVWNDTDEHRAVLLIQFARPTAWPGRLVGEGFRAALSLSPIGRDVRQRFKKWEDKYARSENEAGSGAQS
ncbi:MAG: aspartyl/asparaginyl beta-hydroxylase domain-containing protein [Kiloniellales bacterium]|nr:aspartyl/asparaginyl beta-hydroxylase domain-containing protein [Kiloniellales bacterium]